MKKVFAFILLFLCTMSVFPVTAHAQEQNDPSTLDGLDSFLGDDPMDQGEEDSPTLDELDAFFGDDAPDDPNSINAPGQQVPPDGQPQGELDCGWTDVSCGIAKIIGWIFMGVTQLVSVVAALITDFSIWFSIQNTFYHLANPFMEAGWKLVRDFTNLMFIFALFFAAFSLILNRESERLQPKRTIALVIIMALLINFSFLMARSIIDVGNLFANTLYQKITTSVENTSVDENVSGLQQAATVITRPSDFFKNVELDGMKSISVGLLDKINPQSLLAAAGRNTKEDGFFVAYLFISLISAIFNVLLTYIFLSMAVLFLFRMITLTLMVVFSPIAFVSVVIPSWREKQWGFNGWLAELVGLSMMAPIYLVFVYLTVMFLDVKLPGVDGFLMASVVILIKLLIVAFILLRGKKMATDMSGAVGKAVSSMANGVVMAGVGVATAGTGLLATQTVGRLGAGLARSGTIQRVANTGSATVQSLQNRMGTGIRRLGVGSFGKRVANSVATRVETSQVSQKVAQGVRSLGKNVATVNPLDRQVMGVSARKAAGFLGELSGNKDLKTGLAKDYVKGVGGLTGIKAMTQANAQMDEKALENEQKTLTRSTENAFASALSEFGREMSGGSASTPPRPATPTAIPVPPGATTTATQPPANPVTGPQNTFNPTAPVTSSTTQAQAQNQTDTSAAEQYDINRRQDQEKGANISVDTLHVNNLVVNKDQANNATVRQSANTNSTTNTASASSNRAASLLSGIRTSTKPVGALSYNPNQEQKNASVETKPENSYESYQQDKEKLATVAGNAANALSQENLSRMGGVSIGNGAVENKPTLEQKENLAGALGDLDHSNTLSESDDNHFDFGGIQLPEQE